MARRTVKQDSREYQPKRDEEREKDLHNPTEELRRKDEYIGVVGVCLENAIRYTVFLSSTRTVGFVDSGSRIYSPLYQGTLCMASQLIYCLDIAVQGVWAHMLCDIRKHFDNSI
jgi:hypothetical protein